MEDKTNFIQSLMHMIKGNLGTGILAMPASFAHTGLINAILGLPVLCLIATYCVNILVNSARQLEGRSKGLNLQYAGLAKHSFKSGPRWMRSSSSLMCHLVDVTLVVTQLGVCCVYVIFIVDNVTSILASNSIYCSKILVFASIFPCTLLLSYIRTLKRLAIASAIANFLQMIGIVFILEYLIRDIDKIDLASRDKFRPLNEVALGFGSAMFAFEGISVVLPVYTRLKRPEKMSGGLGVVNISYVILLILYFVMGFFGYLKFGREAKGSITLNLPPEPIYDAVRAMFTISVLLTYPLQFYVPNEILWVWAKKNLLIDVIDKSPNVSAVRAVEVVIPAINISEKGGLQAAIQAQSSLANNNIVLQSDTKKSINDLPSKDEKAIMSYSNQESKNANIVDEKDDGQLLRYDYLCRTILVTITFILALSVPKLNLLMDLIGSVSGTILGLLLPPIIHIAAFWDDRTGCEKVTMVLVDTLVIAFAIIAGASGAVSSMASIIKSFNN